MGQEVRGVRRIVRGCRVARRYQGRSGQGSEGSTSSTSGRASDSNAQRAIAMNPRQSVLIAMFLSLVIFLLANVHMTTIQGQIGSLKQVPKA
jgi:hypothetical protein